MIANVLELEHPGGEAGSEDGLDALRVLVCASWRRAPDHIGAADDVAAHELDKLGLS
jgi:hypothetical protein